MAKKNFLWRICNCTGKDEAPGIQTCARWSMAFALLGVFCLIFGAFAIKVSFDPTAASSGNWWEAAIVLMVGGSLLAFAGLLTAFMACCFYCCKGDKEIEKDQISVYASSVSLDMRSSSA